VVENLEIGGLEKVVLSLALGLDRKRFRPLIVCLGYGGELLPEVERAGVPVEVLGKRPGLSLWLPIRLAWLFKRRNLEIVHCHNLGPLMYGALAARLGGLAGVVYQRLGLVDHFVTVSEDARRVAIERAGVRADAVETVVNGIDVDAYNLPLNVGEKRRSIGVPEDAIVFGIVARLSAAKDHRNLFRAFQITANRHPRARLVLVGDGELRRDLEADVAELGIEHRVFFLGSRHDVPQLLSTFDVFVLSSYTEGLAVTLLEAMAAGLPVVATDVGGNREVVRDGETGVLVPARDTEKLAEAMAGMIADPDRAKRMGASGRERARSVFGIDAMVARYQERYEHLIGRSR
jgi:glycosyltransferase involved in cell wall biosynthesis